MSFQYWFGAGWIVEESKNDRVLAEESLFIALTKLAVYVLSIAIKP